MHTFRRDYFKRYGGKNRYPLGPLFFLCYINDITHICKNSKILLYADDTVLYKGISEHEK